MQGSLQIRERLDAMELVKVLELLEIIQLHLYPLVRGELTIDLGALGYQPVGIDQAPAINLIRGLMGLDPDEIEDAAPVEGGDANREGWRNVYEPEVPNIREHLENLEQEGEPDLERGEGGEQNEPHAAPHAIPAVAPLRSQLSFTRHPQWLRLLVLINDIYLGNSPNMVESVEWCKIVAYTPYVALVQCIAKTIADLDQDPNPLSALPDLLVAFRSFQRSNSLITKLAVAGAAIIIELEARNRQYCIAWQTIDRLVGIERVMNLLSGLAANQAVNPNLDMAAMSALGNSLVGEMFAGVRDRVDADDRVTIERYIPRPGEHGPANEGLN